jgi:iron complex transport system substrate-binding protein
MLFSYHDKSYQEDSMLNRKIYPELIALIFILATLAACGPAPTPTPVVPTATPTPAVTLTPTPVPVIVTDSANRQVVLAGLPQRIVSLAPSTTEIAFALGLGKRVIAVDRNSDFPAETRDLPKVSMIPINLEQIVEYKPDLVLAASITNSDDVKKLEDLKLKVLVVGSPTATFDNILADIALVGKATGTETQAKTVIDAIKLKLDAVQAKIATAKTKPRVYWEIDATDATKPYTTGPGSFIHDLIIRAGGLNIASNAKIPWVQINVEEVIYANPDIVILSNGAYVTPESVKARKGWNVINAVKNNKVFPIDESIVSRAGPRIADGLEAAAKLIQPELFK